ncbi:hypothetical protein [Calycomorphotria hydatis]|uniref:4Fe-4S ferredoxin-type domain-containing protein n=1 Tax=Calycomorphotria hydatis TaxID=2528027 RepID=A0A517T7H7_9PLAN|nr:hypothetical protein [Calycomorphotria hydatis]QDT64323.1 hypothetical protein V22_15560 [Calycomorphotria hydatis]
MRWVVYGAVGYVMFLAAFLCSAGDYCCECQPAKKCWIKSLIMKPKCDDGCCETGCVSSACGSGCNGCKPRFLGCLHRLIKHPKHCGPGMVWDFENGCCIE